MLYTDDPGESRDDDKELESSSAGFQSPTCCSDGSADSDGTLAESEPCHLEAASAVNKGFVEVYKVLKSSVCFLF